MRNPISFRDILGDSAIASVVIGFVSKNAVKFVVKTVVKQLVIRTYNKIKYGKFSTTIPAQ